MSITYLFDYLTLENLFYIIAIFTKEYIKMNKSNVTGFKLTNGAELVAKVGAESDFTSHHLHFALGEQIEVLGVEYPMCPKIGLHEGQKPFDVGFFQTIKTRSC